MSKKIAPRVQLNFAPDEPEHVSDEEGLISDEELDLPCEVPDVIERKKIVQNDIFDNVNPSLNGMGEDMIIEEDEPPPAPRKKVQKQTDTAKPKRKLSDEHAAKLALAREKALATRRAHAEEKKKMKKIEDETKELKKKKAQKDLETLKDEVIHNKPSLQNQQISNNTFTRQELEDAQLDAIMKYEAIRKARKEEKRKQQLIDQQKEQLKQKIQGYGARDANGRLLNKWDRCY
jgi:hypothetical protein